MDYKQKLTGLIDIVIAQGASDLHMSEGIQPTLRVSGSLTPILTEAKLTKEDMQGLVAELLSPEQKGRFEKTQEIDFSYAYGEKGRFRGNAFIERGGIGVALRLIPRSIRTLAELHLPQVLETFAGRQ